MEKTKYKMNKSKIKLLTFILLVLVSNSVLAEAYFDISDDNIKIETNFIGKEVIIFGILNDDQDTILTIKGPEKNAVIQKKERILGFWFNTKQITYNQIPSIFFIASSNNIEDILPASTIIKEELSFNYLLENKTSQRNFISDVSLEAWKNNFVRIKKSENLFKEYSIEKIDNKERIITLKKSGIGNHIYNFAHNNAAAYGLFAIIFAILSGFLAATLFRRY